MSKFLYLLPLFSIILFYNVFGTVETDIRIGGGLTPDYVFNTSPTSFSGTYSSSDPQLLPGTITKTPPPVITIVLDSNNYGPVSFGGGVWSVSGAAVSDGWHTLDAFITDSTGSRTSEIQFEVITQKFTPSNPYKNFIDVLYSNTCQTLVDHNDTSDCPSVEELSRWDTSNKHISGYFYHTPNGLKRTDPQLTNHYIFYNNSPKTIVCVLCTTDFSHIDITKTIFIVPKGLTYTITDPTVPADQITSLYNNQTLTLNENAKSLTVFYDRYVTGCLTAEISYSKNLMNDTLKYLESNCTIKPQINKTTTIKPIIPIVDYNNSPQVLYEKWLLQSKIVNLGNCINQKCVQAVNPEHAKGFGWG